MSSKTFVQAALKMLVPRPFLIADERVSVGRVYGKVPMLGIGLVLQPLGGRADEDQKKPCQSAWDTGGRGFAALQWESARQSGKSFVHSASLQTGTGVVSVCFRVKGFFASAKPCAGFAWVNDAGSVGLAHIAANLPQQWVLLCQGRNLRDNIGSHTSPFFGTCRVLVEFGVSAKT